MVMYNCVHTGCAYKTKKAKHLERHQSIHTGERPYACSHPGCSHRASERDHIRTHERRHTGEKPYACPVDNCGYRAARHDAVKLHQRRNHDTMQPVCVYEAGEQQGHPCRCLHCASAVTHPGTSTGRRRRAPSDVDAQSSTSCDSQSRQHSPSVSTTSSDFGPRFPPIPARDAIGPCERGRVPTVEPEEYPVQDFELGPHSGFTSNGRPFSYQYPPIGSPNCHSPPRPYPSPTRTTTRSRHVIERLDVGLGLHRAYAHSSRPMYTLPRPSLSALSPRNCYTPDSHLSQPRTPYICHPTTAQRCCSPPYTSASLSAPSSAYAPSSQRSMSVEPACIGEATVTMPFSSPPPPPKYRIIRWGPNGRQEGDALS